MLENIFSCPTYKPTKIHNVNKDVPCLYVVEHENSRLFSLLRKQLQGFIEVDLINGKSLKNYPHVVIFWEYLGEDSDFPHQTFNSVQKRYPDTEITLCIDDVYEGLIDEEYIKIIENSNLDISKWFVVTSNNKLSHDNVFVLNYHLYNSYFDNVWPKHVEFDYNQTLREKKFFCPNRQERLHRILAVDHFIKKDFVKHSYISCPFVELQYAISNKDLLEDNFGTKITDLSYNRKYKSIDELLQYNFSENQISRFQNSLPLYLEGEENKHLSARNLPDISSYFKQSYWSIVTERDFFKSDQYEGFTEKTVKCILFGHPFIIIGLPNTLSYLRKLGFMTFGRFIDESYDNIQDDDKRLCAAFEQIDNLAALNYNDLQLQRKKMIPILKHNYKRFFEIHNSLPNIEMVNLLEQLADNHHQEL